MPLRFDGKIIATKSCDYQTAFGREGDRESGAVPANSWIWVDLTRNKPEIESPERAKKNLKYSSSFQTLVLYPILILEFYRWRC